MCEYCEMKDRLDSMLYFFDDTRIGFGNLKTHICMDLYMDKEDRAIKADLENEHAENIAHLEVKINYCPMCGRKLRDI